MGVDLSRIEAWTREMLESEAFRRGIRSPEFRTRSELVRLIVRDQYGERLAAGRELIALGARSVASARGALGNAVSAALAALPEPLDTLARLRARLPLGREAEHRPYAQHGAQTTAQSGPPSPWSHSDSPTAPASAADTVEVEAPPQPAVAASAEAGATSSTDATAPALRGGASSPTSEPEDSRATWVESDSSVAAAVAYERVVAAERESLMPAGAAPSAPLTVPAGTFAPPARSDVGFRTPSLIGTAPALRGGASSPPPAPYSTRSAATRTFVEEPIRTVSMARLLASQGHRERALAIYEELIAQNSEDASLQDAAQALRRGDDAQVKPLSAPPSGEEEPTLPESADRLWCEGMPTEGMRLRWELSEHGQQRARAVLGRDGELAIRVVSIAFDPIRVVRSEITEHGPIDASGEWTAPALHDSARCFAAVGLRDGERFVAVVHARAS